jgi:hypothetical protein
MAFRQGKLGFQIAARLSDIADYAIALGPYAVSLWL